MLKIRKYGEVEVYSDKIYLARVLNGDNEVALIGIKTQRNSRLNLRNIAMEWKVNPKKDLNFYLQKIDDLILNIETNGLSSRLIKNIGGESNIGEKSKANCSDDLKFKIDKYLVLKKENGQIYNPVRKTFASELQNLEGQVISLSAKHGSFKLDLSNSLINSGRHKRDTLLLNRGSIRVNFDFELLKEISKFACDTGYGNYEAINLEKCIGAVYNSAKYNLMKDVWFF